jgi:hypothetical protein
MLGIAMVFAYDLLGRPDSVLAAYGRDRAADVVDTAYDSGVETGTDAAVEVTTPGDPENAFAALDLVDTPGAGDSDDGDFDIGEIDVASVVTTLEAESIPGAELSRLGVVSIAGMVSTPGVVSTKRAVATPGAVSTPGDVSTLGGEFSE